MLTVVVVVVEVDGSEVMRRLLKDLFTNYNGDARPLINDNDTLKVKIKHTVSFFSYTFLGPTYQ